MNTALTSTKRFADEILKTPIEFPTAQEKMSAIVKSGESAPSIKLTRELADDSVSHCGRHIE
jgi:hypothetical protein